MKRNKAKLQSASPGKKGGSAKRFGPPDAKSDSESDKEAAGAKSSAVPAKYVPPAPTRKVEKFMLEKCTTLVFVTLSGGKREVLLTRRVMSYLELQQDIARYNRKSAKAFVVQDEDGHVIHDTPFPGYDVIRIKEIGFRPNPKVLKELGTRWETENYYFNDPYSTIRARPAATEKPKEKVVVIPTKKKKDEEEDDW